MVRDVAKNTFQRVHTSLNDILEMDSFDIILRPKVILVACLWVLFKILLAKGRPLLQRILRFAEHSDTIIDDFVVRSLLLLFPSDKNEKDGKPSAAPPAFSRDSLRLLSACDVIVAYTLAWTFAYFFLSDDDFLPFSRPHAQVYKTAFVLRVLLPLSSAAHLFVRDIGAFAAPLLDGESGAALDDEALPVSNHHKTLASLLTGVMIFFGVLIILGEAGYDMSAAFTGLGLGGIALGLALQGVIKEIFMSCILLLDRPFQVGDFIEASSISGVVLRVGLRSVLIRSYSDGQYVQIPNSRIADSAIVNWERVQHYSRTIKIVLPFSTPEEVLRRLPGVLRERINDLSERNALPRVQCTGSFISSVTAGGIEVASRYRAHTKDLKTSKAVHQSVIIEILSEINASGLKLVRAADRHVRMVREAEETFVSE